MSKKVAVIMGSTSDLERVRPAVELLEKYGVPCEVRVMSAHRTPGRTAEFAEAAAENGFGVIIAAAGKAAHLAGAVAANTVLPVIGIPISGHELSGLDALLATVQMPSGIPVATVGIDGAANAAMLAVQILALSDAALCQKLADARLKMAADVEKKDAELCELLKVGK